MNRRIFLSYARGDDEPSVALLHADLTACGFDVWWDRVSMPARGLTFLHEIRDTIDARERFLLVLGPKPVTSDYVIGVKGGNIQTILVESEQEVQPPVNIGHIQWLDMHDWKERRARGEVAWEQWYQLGQRDKPNHHNAPRVVRSPVWYLATGWCFAARDFCFPLGASDEHTL